MTKPTGPTNPNLKNLIRELKKLSKKEDVKIWRAVAKNLEKPTRQRRIVDLDRISRVTKENENIVVPGKVLSKGNLTHKITIAAWQFSEKAKEKIKKKGKAISIQDLIKENPKGKKIRIIG